MWIEDAVRMVLNQIYIQFTLQLLISESIFLIHKPRRVYSGWYFFLSFVILICAGWGWSHIAAACFEPQSMGYAIIYIGFSVLSFLWILWNYDMNPMEALFVAAGGYAVEHISFTITRVFLYITRNYIPYPDTSFLLFSVPDL